jgi:uncharacterized DUF497 family protein
MGILDEALFAIDCKNGDGRRIMLDFKNKRYELRTVVPSSDGVSLVSWRTVTATSMTSLANEINEYAPSRFWSNRCIQLWDVTDSDQNVFVCVACDWSKQKATVASLRKATEKERREYSGG